MKQEGKNIVLCTDGTGNSADDVSKSNVWRLYEALDKSKPEKQVACYIRGVGTSNIRIIRLIGGAFGFGLAGNVRVLYKFLCENYRPACENYQGDRIYIFGFSRGAFTARILVSFIHRCGILDRSKTIETKEGELLIGSNSGMDRAVRTAYASFRKAAPAKT